MQASNAVNYATAARILTPQQEDIMNKTEIVRETIRRFEHLPDRTIARYILHNYGDLFDGNLENIRGLVRYHTGKRKGGSGKCPNPIQTNPSMPLTWRRKRTLYKLTPGLYLVCADLHVPFHEPKPIEAMIKCAQDEGVDGILYNGDIQDCAAVSYWPSTRKRDFDKELESTIDFFDFMEKALPVKNIVYKPGNHEYRLPRYYYAKAPELIGMPMITAVDMVLGLELRGIEFLDYHQLVMAGKLPILHGHEVQAITKAVNPARGLALRTKSWSMCAHCHRTSEHTDTNITGTLLTTWSIGCLCDMHPDYAPYGTNWNWGFAIVNVEKNGNFEVVNRRILPNGKVV